MDWTGQKLAESLCIYLTLGFGLVSFVVGYAMQDFALMMKIYGAGVAVTGLATIPDWPWLNRNPLSWLPVEEKEEEGGEEEGEKKKKGRSAAAKKEEEGEEEEEEEEEDGDHNNSPSSSPSLKTTTKRATKQRRQPVIE